MNECCEKLEDRVPYESEEELPPDVEVSVCSSCGCRHFELTVDPGRLGVTGKSL